MKNPEQITPKSPLKQVEIEKIQPYYLQKTDLKRLKERQLDDLFETHREKLLRPVSRRVTFDTPQK